MRSLHRLTIALAALALAGCINPTYDKQPQPYGVEKELTVQTLDDQVWAVAPAVNLSGQREADPLLQADIVFQQLQQVHGMTAIPVNRVLEVYSGLHIERVESQQQAELVCHLLGANALLVPTVTAYDPYDPPKLGASLELFIKPSDYQPPPLDTDVRQLGRNKPADTSLVKQAVGMFDATDGTVLVAVHRYAAGRNDPNGPLSEREYLLSMDRYCGFAYHELIGQLILQQSGGY